MVPLLCCRGRPFDFRRVAPYAQDERGNNPYILSVGLLRPESKEAEAKGCRPNPVGHNDRRVVALHLTMPPPCPDNEDMTKKTTAESSQDWISQLRAIYDQAVDRFEQGQRGPEKVVGPEALAFLDSIGTSVQELYDFVEDWVEDGEPEFDAVAAMTGVRREYFLTVQEGKRSDAVIPSASLPSGYAKLGGYQWLPRIIAKARAKLRGELAPDIMFGCGADRPFLRSVNMEPAEFLKAVWDAGTDDRAILNAVQKKASTLSTSPSLSGKGLP